MQKRPECFYLLFNMKTITFIFSYWIHFCTLALGNL